MCRVFMFEQLKINVIICIFITLFNIFLVWALNLITYDIGEMSLKYYVNGLNNKPLKIIIIAMIIRLTLAYVFTHLIWVFTWDDLNIKNEIIIAIVIIIGIVFLNRFDLSADPVTPCIILMILEGVIRACVYIAKELG